MFSRILDQCIAEFDVALRTATTSPAVAERPNPATGVQESSLSPGERDLAARLMRVNHSGEIAAQALYRGQALVARDETLRAELLQAAREEHDHLAWCEQRARELGGGISLFTPLWYLGSLGIGAVAGLAGDRLSLGFLAETERQVGEHLDGHLQRLPAQDERTRAIVTQMRSDEAMHQEYARARGAAALPFPIRLGMRLTSKIMTTISNRL